LLSKELVLSQVCVGEVVLDLRFYFRVVGNHF
jgi:hypothetical protein